ncbi:unnamed protein product [Rotaria sordida]|uniref:Uncharacterized protein n=1 Tax=Rotaria sordida TaxID=392033 RepID=A0A815PGI2_9BILA|nr:unnamed protein product [Rotaria sordida]CAF4054920.1 unnamed protein product [Rotaria sordida]
MMLDDQMKIRHQIIEEFQKRNLEVSIQIIEPSTTNRNDAEHRKELYTRLSQYLDRRQIRNRGQTYIFLDLINQMIRGRFLNDIRGYQTAKLSKMGNSTM